VLTDVALHEDGRTIGIETGGEQLSGGDPRAPPQLIRLGRDRQRVEVGDEVERLVGLLERDVLPHRTEIVPEMERVGSGLDTRKNTRAGHDIQFCQESQRARDRLTPHPSTRRRTTCSLPFPSRDTAARRT
jgi:hypothetical protein